MAGTSVGGDLVEDVRDEAEKRDVVEKVKGKSRGAAKRRK